jgi:hypothetical protein
VNWLQTKELALSPTCVGAGACAPLPIAIHIGVGIWPYVPKQLNKDKRKVSNDCNLKPNTTKKTKE